jgi:hypothetical protein
MIVFCSQCGQKIEADPGSRVMCPNCTAVFTAPADGSAGADAPAPTPVQTQDRAPNYIPPYAQNPSAYPVPMQPQVGQPISQINPSGQPKTNGLAIASLVSGILCCIPFSGVAAIIMGAMAIGQINANPSQQQGKGLAIAGISIGSVSIALVVLSAIINALMYSRP